LIPTVRQLVQAGVPAPRCVQLLAAWAACLCGPRAGGFALADAALDATSTRSPSLRPDGMVPGGAVRRLLSLPGFLDVTKPRESAFVREVELAGRDLWYRDVRLALSAPSLPARPNGRPHLGRLAEADATEVPG
jgi:hypothetical protein